LVANDRFSWPTRDRSSFWMAVIFLMASCPVARASTITASGISPAPASTITMASSVPATSRLSWLFVLRSAVEGLTTQAPSQYPTRTAPTACSKGMSEITRAVDAPMMDRVSESFSRSAESSSPITWVSQA
jgi:hypothetical protein